MDNWSSALRGALLPCAPVGLPAGHSLLIEFLYCHPLGPVSMALASNSGTHTHLFLVPTLKWRERKLYFGFVFSHHLLRITKRTAYPFPDDGLLVGSQVSSWPLHTSPAPGSPCRVWPTMPGSLLCCLFSQELDSSVGPQV